MWKPFLLGSALILASCQGVDPQGGAKGSLTVKVKSQGEKQIDSIQREMAREGMSATDIALLVSSLESIPDLGDPVEQAKALLESLSSGLNNTLLSEEAR